MSDVSTPLNHPFVLGNSSIEGADPQVPVSYRIVVTSKSPEDFQVTAKEGSKLHLPKIEVDLHGIMQFDFQRKAIIGMVKNVGDVSVTNVDVVFTATTGRQIFGQPLDSIIEPNQRSPFRALFQVSDGTVSLKLPMDWRADVTFDDPEPAARVTASGKPSLPCLRT